MRAAEENGANFLDGSAFANLDIKAPYTIWTHNNSFSVDMELINLEAKNYYLWLDKWYSNINDMNQQ